MWDNEVKFPFICLVNDGKSILRILDLSISKDEIASSEDININPFYGYIGCVLAPNQKYHIPYEAAFEKSFGDFTIFCDYETDGKIRGSDYLISFKFVKSLMTVEDAGEVKLKNVLP